MEHSSEQTDSLNQFLSAARELADIARRVREFGGQESKRILLEQGVPAEIHNSIESYNRGSITTRELQAQFFGVFLNALDAASGSGMPEINSKAFVA